MKFCVQAFGLYFLIEIFTIVKFSLKEFNAFFEQLLIQGNIIFHGFAHFYRSGQRTEIKACAVTFGTPVLDIISVVVRFLKDTFMSWVPCFDAVIETIFDFWPQCSEPHCIA